MKIGALFLCVNAVVPAGRKGNLPVIIIQIKSGRPKKLTGVFTRFYY